MAELEIDPVPSTPNDIPTTRDKGVENPSFDQNGPRKKRIRGQNNSKQRMTNSSAAYDEKALRQLCSQISSCGACDYGSNCAFRHDIEEFMTTDKLPDIRYTLADLECEMPCPSFERYGLCLSGANCRVGSRHLSSSGVNLNKNGEQITAAEVAEMRRAREDNELDEVNYLKASLRVSLMKNKTSLPRSAAFLKSRGLSRRDGGYRRNPVKRRKGVSGVAVVGDASEADSCNEEENCPQDEQGNVKDVEQKGDNALLMDSRSSNPLIEAQNNETSPFALETSEHLVADKPSETITGETVGNIIDGGCGREAIATRRAKTSKIFDRKAVLAPLTTVGNIPFRRICVEMGADVTVGEMAMASSVVSGKPSDTTLLKRHKSERCFGVQIAAGFPDIAARCGEVLSLMGLDADFVDINSGCPLTGMHKRGAGSILMTKHSHFANIIAGLNSMLDCPVTVKVRTAHDTKEQHTALAMMPLFRHWGAAAVTVHGRTHKQRYSKSADWSTIGRCAAALNPSGEHIPLIGNGDVLTYEDYVRGIDTGVDSVMVGRGALIKPWVFTEIKEQRVWDISAQERLEILRKFASYGLEHWGSDSVGVTKTRRFLLEWLAFMHRYTPIGLMEQADRPTEPNAINLRQMTFVGRNELETKMLSPNTKEWIWLTELVLGKTPDGFSFVPKHKSSSADDNGEG